MGHSCVIALTGKGGVGKTSLSAAILRILTEEKPEAKILAIDADPAVGLSVALGVDVKETLDDIRLRVAKDVTEGLSETQDIGSLSCLLCQNQCLLNGLLYRLVILDTLSQY